MGIIVWIFIGLVAGWLASVVMRYSHGIVLDVVLGLVGALVGGSLASALLSRSTSSLGGHLMVAFLGAVLLLAIHRALFAGRAAAGRPV